MTEIIKMFFVFCLQFLFFQDRILAQRSNCEINDSIPHFDARTNLGIDDLDITSLSEIEFDEVAFLYQSDSIMVDLQKGYDFFFRMGDACFDSHYEKYILRVYGNWLKTLEILTYDLNDELKGNLILYAKGGEHDSSHKMNSVFDSDSTFGRTIITKTYSDEIGPNQVLLCTDSSYSKFLVKDNGEISKLAEYSISMGECEN